MDLVRLWTSLLVILTLSVLRIRGISRRQKRDDFLFRRLESLSIRVENMEVDLRQEQRKSESLKKELDEVKKRITACEEKPKGRGGVGELPEAAVKTLADLARKTFQADLDVLTSGMIAEKHRSVQAGEAIEFCKTTLNKHSSRLDAIEGNVSELDDRLVNLNTTVMAVNKSCSQCSAHASGNGNEVTSGQCPLTGRVVTKRETLRSINLGSEICKKQNFMYAFYVTVKKILNSPDSEPRTAEITIGAGIQIGHRQIHRNVRAYLTLSRDCPWSDVSEGKSYLIVTDQALKAQGQRHTLSLKGSVIMNFSYEGTSISKRLLVRYTETLLYHLRQGNWRQLCRGSK